MGLPGGEAFGAYKGQEFRTSDGLMFAVDDMYAFVREARARGIDIDGTPVCQMAFGKGSEGNGFIFHHRGDGTVGPEITKVSAPAP
ncbi:hypothetical protein WPS_20530 [Vulcanimicrobium alpinum]|uniref:VOC domain-containing protein n=1 Tax=Vulcanimicrobium alpinum TaxID=3016050 RepID=A0AAN2CAM9_UNVUL|nr:hypothetical protein [Vulcanimicrobium alpinum]BDE06777.1 hypothetical protein WPS_20530 [Vulcanimicrobium alpinum]